jgi:predicted HTH domain antitoxin
MLIEIRDETISGLALTREQALLELAVGLYTDGRITMGRAATIAEMNQSDFQCEIGKRGITQKYDIDDLRSDLRTLASLRNR